MKPRFLRIFGPTERGLKGNFNGTMGNMHAKRRERKVDQEEGAMRRTIFSRMRQ